eukprot:NODE_2648_length_1127_cov_75.964000_g2526_i0.p1 GENE.NODE_2648_length_1127_cov_75.964000_g2526_i0~~NODE_2648_length_1127_cov_75.964000_g2526_i0.p1  ORF type:complete len:304 (-),score=51.92 NODE_2648_length_1127_cov_75.964000_g2526_i0:153-1064(-)
MCRGMLFFYLACVSAVAPELGALTSTSARVFIERLVPETVAVTVNTLFAPSGSQLIRTNPEASLIRLDHLSPATPYTIKVPGFDDITFRTPNSTHSATRARSTVMTYLARSTFSINAALCEKTCGSYSLSDMEATIRELVGSGQVASILNTTYVSLRKESAQWNCVNGVVLAKRLSCESTSTLLADELCDALEKALEDIHSPLSQALYSCQQNERDQTSWELAFELIIPALIICMALALWGGRFRERRHRHARQALSTTTSSSYDPPLPPAVHYLAPQPAYYSAGYNPPAPTPFSTPYGQYPY